LLGGSPWLLLVFFPTFLIFHYIQQYYRNASREIQRIEPITRSPIYSLFSETLSGLSSIRAFEVQKSFCMKNINYTDINGKCFFINQCVK
jgi:hypothetical protein